MKLAMIGLSVLTLTALPAAAQTFQAPNFYALQQQQQTQNQASIDAQQKRIQDEQMRAIQHPQTAAQSAIRQSELQSQLQQSQVQIEQQRQQIARENAIAETSLPNRRIAKSSLLVVSDPVRYGLPAAPPGQYYARLNGRFVLVDASSELVVKVLDPTPLDPTGDLPAATPPEPLAPAPIARPGRN